MLMLFIHKDTSSTSGVFHGEVYYFEVVDQPPDFDCGPCAIVHLPLSLSVR
jgi:hypothetical protein